MELGTWVGVDRAHPSPFASLGLAGGLKSTHHGDRNESSSQDPSPVAVAFNNNGYQDSEVIHTSDICPEVAGHLTGVGGRQPLPWVPARCHSGVAYTLHSPGEQGTFMQPMA